MGGCSACPRACGALRERQRGSGICQSGTLPKVAKAALHMWEEPCISGTRGSGTVFFSGCALRCPYCQNQIISHGNFGRVVSVLRLREIYGELIRQGAHNINLVSPTHFSQAILASLSPPVPVPVVYNCSGYETPETLKTLQGKINIYLPDIKFLNGALAARYCGAPDYPERAKAAVLEMFGQTGPYRLSPDGLLESGVMIRHLMLPGLVENTLDVIDWVLETFPAGGVMLSLMSQYTPCGDLSDFPEINRPISEQEYRRVEDYLSCSRWEDGYVQQREAAGTQYIPNFNLQGVERDEEFDL